MRYLALFAMVLGLTSGCALVFDDRNDSCLLAEPAIAPATQLNPETLECESFGDGCRPECGPCPELDTAPSPTWGFCGGPCHGLSEAACTSDTRCRVVKDAQCAVSGDCATDFAGCFPVDQQSLADVACSDARDGETCSKIARCIAYHRSAVEPISDRPFAMCGPQGQAPGSCYGAVACDAVPPRCPAQTRPGIAGGCYTGLCIPLDICGPAPQQ